MRPLSLRGSASHRSFQSPIIAGRPGSAQSGSIYRGICPAKILARIAGPGTAGWKPASGRRNRLEAGWVAGRLAALQPIRRRSGLWIAVDRLAERQLGDPGQGRDGGVAQMRVDRYNPELLVSIWLTTADGDGNGCWAKLSLAWHPLTSESVVAFLIFA